MRSVVFGTGGFGREVAWIVESRKDIAGPFLGYLDDQSENHGKKINGFPVLGGREWLTGQTEPIAVFMGIGTPETRHKIVTYLRALSHVRFPVLVHPQVSMGREVQLGEGSIICAGNILTCNIQLGSFVNLNLDCTVGHDTIIEDFTTIAPGVHISGNVTVGRGCDLGTGAAVIQGITIGASVTLGAGAVVNRNLPEGVTAVGVPAKAIKIHEAYNFS